MATRMQQRRGTAQQWTDANPTLAAGEIGFETSSGKFKIGDGVNTWSNLSYFADAADFDTSVIESTIDSKVATAVDALVAGAPAALNTLNEIAEAINDDASFSATIVQSLSEKTSLNTVQTLVSNEATRADAAILSHANETEGVHGITDTSVLETITGSQGKADAAKSGAEATAASELSSHNSDTENVHGIANTAALATMDFAEQQVSDHNSNTVNVHGIADTALLATTGNVATAKGEAITEAETKISEHNTDTTNVHGIADTSVLATATTVATAKGEAIDAAAVASENYTDGVVAALTKSSVGLGNVDNTSDADKPVSTAQASAIATAKDEAIAAVNDVIASAPAALNTLDELAAALGDDANFATTVTNGLAAKAPLANPTFTGTVTVAASGVAFTDGTQTKAGVPSITSFATGISSSATLASGEQDKFVPLTGAVTITLPASGYSTGQSIDFYQASGTGAQFASTNSVVGTPGLKLRTTNSVATAMKTSSGWLVFGDLSA